MSFVFINLLIFTTIVFLFYYLVPSKFQWIVLLSLSFIFYALMDFKAIIYIVLTISTVFFCAKLIHFIHKTQAELFNNCSKEWLMENRQKVKKKYDSQRKIILVICLVFNFGILAVLKYFNFFTRIFNSIFLNRFNISIPGVNWLLPIGISFYTFQSIGYIIDVYRKKYKAEGNIAKLALFISFFPQIIQGPIGRYDHLAPQLFASHKFDPEKFANGLKLIFWGFIKKLLIADVLSPFVAKILNDNGAEGITITTGVIMGMIQLYADFSGGIDVSRGIARCMGIEIAENFKRPYFAISLSDFWRRWHITLGTWMRDYLFYEITFSKLFFKLQKNLRKWFGNYIGKILPSCFAMTFIFIIVGLWHGAAVKWIIFGFYNGFFISLGILFQPVTDKLRTLIKRNIVRYKIFNIMCVFKTLVLVFFGRCIAGPGGFLQGWSFIKRIVISMFSPSTWLLLPLYLKKYNFGTEQIILLFPPVAVLLTVSLLQENGIVIRNFSNKVPLVFRYGFYCFFICYILFFAKLVDVGVYLYGQF